MAITALTGIYDGAQSYDIRIGTGFPLSGATINVGDYLAYSGSAVFPTYVGQASTAYTKASGAGVALESNPVYDRAGRLVQNTGLKFLREGVFKATAAFSGFPGLSQGAYPAATGSAVGGVTGLTGVGATWQTGVKLQSSGSTGAGGSGIAQVIGWQTGPGGTGQLDILLVAPRPDFY